MLTLFLCGMFVLDIPCCLHFYAGSFFYTSHAGFVFVLIGEFLLHIPYWLYFLSGELLLHIPWLLFISVGSLSYTSRVSISLFNVVIFSSTSHAGFIFMRGVSLTHPGLASFLSGEFLLHIPCSVHFCLGTLSYTSHADFVFMWEVCLRLPVLASFLCGEFLLHIPCWLCFFKVFISGVSLTHPVRASFLYWVLLLQIECWLLFISREFLLHIP